MTNEVAHSVSAKHRRRLLPFLVGLGLLLSIAFGYIFKWPFVGVVTYSYNPDGTIKGITDVRTLWDWLQLIIVPVMIAFGLWWLDQQQKVAQGREEAQEKALSSDRENQASLDAYLDKVGDLVLAHRDSMQQAKPIISLRTLAILRMMDSKRKALVIRFLYDAGLLYRKTDDYMAVTDQETRFAYVAAPVDAITITNADLAHADFTSGYFPRIVLLNVNLTGARLVNCIMPEADLRFSTLTQADLSRADLSNANLYRSSLKGANLKGANMTAATLREATLSDATFDDSTSWPEGFDPTAAGATKAIA